MGNEVKEVSEYRGVEGVSKSELRSEEGDGHPLGCDCLECFSTTPRYVRYAK